MKEGVRVIVKKKRFYCDRIGMYDVDDLYCLECKSCEAGAPLC